MHEHPESGLSVGNKHHSDATKAAVTAQLLVGNSGRYIEQKTGVPRTTVRRAAETITKRVDVGKRRQIGDMLLELVAESVEGGIHAAGLLRNDAYIKGHSPSEVAVLAGVLMDKAFLILAAAERYQLGDGSGEREPDTIPTTDEPAVDVSSEAPSDSDRGA